MTLGFLAIVILPTITRWERFGTLALAVLSGGALVAAGLAQRREDRSREDKDVFVGRLIERMHARMFSAASVATGAEEPASHVSESDPRVYVDVLDERKAVHSKTIFSLRNRGRSVAHRVQIQPLKLNCGEATFPMADVLGPDEVKAVIPEIEKIMPVWRHDISRIMLKEWDAAGDIGIFEFVRPMSITYEDYNSRRQWQTTFDLVYHVVQDIIERDWQLSEKPEILQVRNTKFNLLK